MKASDWTLREPPPDAIGLIPDEFGATGWMLLYICTWSTRLDGSIPLGLFGMNA